MGLGGSLNHVAGFLDFFDPLPPMWIILLNKGYVLMWIFREHPLPLVIHMVYGCSLMAAPQNGLNWPNDHF